MKELVDIEFYRTPEGEIMVSDENGLRTYKEEHRDFTESFYALMEDRFPESLEHLSKVYAKSRGNLRYFQFLIVHRFIRCNLGIYDSRKDIDHLGQFSLEEVPCPLRHHECHLFGIVCNPRYNTNLSIRQQEIMRLLSNGNKVGDIAKIMHISPETVKTHRRNAYRKLGVSSLPEYMNLLNKAKQL